MEIGPRLGMKDLAGPVKARHEFLDQEYFGKRILRELQSSKL